VSFALSLADMAAGMARLAASADPAARAVVRAMCHHPDLVAGRGRLCTSLMRAYPGRLVVKVGAEGVYVAGLVESGLGAALKVEDGHGRASMVAIAAVLDQLGLEPTLAETLPDAVALPIRNTRGETVGQIRACGALAHV
jgi:L-asparaginase II